VHEGFHGIFFVNRDFQEFSRRRWEALGPVERRFIRSYFDSQDYDLKDSFLMTNELMAYCLQQPVSQAAEYFGVYLQGKLEASPWRREALPPSREAMGDAFAREAAAFSAYVSDRWGLSAGRISRLRVREE